MGRIRRQRRYKACDPFSVKKKTGNEDMYNQPPKQKEVINDYFVKNKSYLHFQQKIKRGSIKKSTNKGHRQTAIKNDKQTKKTEFQKRGSETNKAFLQRLDRSVQEAFDKAIVKTKTIRKKRKEHLKARDLKKKNKKIDDLHTDFSSFGDKVLFGQIVQQPPCSLPVPRKAPVKEKMSRNLQLIPLLEKKENEIQSVDDRKKRYISKKERMDFDAKRQKAINAYRSLKKKRKQMKDLNEV
ncbi:coiled-coil domain-containing protein 137-like [Hydractinia symbiolongicarpus]|uniref:coiled-coil domain-containing protein 137-like n=1 Tax=Hydractinia symbiolongicarpus TaxID=13093 RepID=UPI00254D2370|nr:coiled-coil domain-containing protein 137-like [Hydractinia symbiolongicarpus]